MIFWDLTEERANRKIASLQKMVEHIGHNDRLWDMRHTSFVAVTVPSPRGGVLIPSNKTSRPPN